MYDFVVDCDKTSNAAEPGIEPALEGKRTDQHTIGQAFHKKLSYVYLAAMVSETVCAEMLSRTFRSNLVGEVVHRKLSYVCWSVNGFRKVCAEVLSRTAYGK
ncbi:hypothetical protein AVEN_30283-1 [Araneus ventricosus]|uniref:Uncharacterized protein n=1 Tax=Araneus ventricosus TaxID=182803 RepID=A0A4Y2HI23_ARAVE|nr:hypothetical protein AVEN_30283-1 [Araneus ventricosus]